jgi:hypothetical protein
MDLKKSKFLNLLSFLLIGLIVGGPSLSFAFQTAKKLPACCKASHCNTSKIQRPSCCTSQDRLPESSAPVSSSAKIGFETFQGLVTGFAVSISDVSIQPWSLRIDPDRLRIESPPLFTLKSSFLI